MKNFILAYEKNNTEFFLQKHNIMLSFITNKKKAKKFSKKEAMRLIQEFKMKDMYIRNYTTNEKIIMDIKEVIIDYKIKENEILISSLEAILNGHDPAIMRLLIFLEDNGITKYRDKEPVIEMLKPVYPFLLSNKEKIRNIHPKINENFNEISEFFKVKELNYENK